MNPESLNKFYNLLDEITVTPNNKYQIIQIKELLEDQKFDEALKILNALRNNPAGPDKLSKSNNSKKDDNQEKEETIKNTDKDDENANTNSYNYPKELLNEKLESTYIGLLLADPKSISKYYFLYEDFYFANEDIADLYKVVLFTDGEAYASEVAKKGYTFAKNVDAIFPLKEDYKLRIKGRIYNFEKIYVELRKLFILRKNYLRIPIKSIQNKIVDIMNYKLYDQMSIEEVESAVNQAEVTSKFKQSILNDNVVNFLTTGSNNLANGLPLPFPILSSVFKGIRKGETTSFAMPSNSGKSRFTINLAAYLAFVHKQKVLVISNEMSEEKMKLCLITTVINNPEIQKIHGQKLKISEGELLELKFRPDTKSKLKLDENGYIARGDNESQEEFIEKLKKHSSDFNKTLAVANWLNEQSNDSIYFINITDHTNDELNKVIKNYYYKDEIQYIFYDTLKADTEHIGSGEAVKKTATILSNLAQNFNVFIGSTLQLTESQTLPINLDVNDLSASRTVKEVLDTLCLMKQIHSDSYDNYEYSKNEVDTEFFNLEKSNDPDVRYYACVVDKNRAGAKPKVLFRLNLAYNSWEELGYLRLKGESNES